MEPILTYKQSLFKQSYSTIRNLFLTKSILLEPGIRPQGLVPILEALCFPQRDDLYTTKHNNQAF